MEDSSNSTVKRYLASISAKALNYSCRLMLVTNLESKQTIQSEKGFIRDYRGLADLMGFQYHEIKALEESEDRTLRILEMWENRPDATLDKLISYLEDMDRHDVLEDLIPLIKRSVDTYIEHEISQIGFQAFDTRPAMYDAYVSYANEDSHLADEYTQVLESPMYGLHLFVRGRDRFDKIYWSELDTDINLVKKKCRRILIFLTKNFMKSTALNFLIKFEESLDSEQKHQTLIPVILQATELPEILLNLTKIDLTKDYIYECMWNRLIASLLPEENGSDFHSSLKGSKFWKKDTSPTSMSIEERLAITFPQASKRKLSSISNSGSADGSDFSLKATNTSSEKAPFLNKSDSSPTLLHQFFSFLKKKGPPTNVTSPSVAETLHSQSSSDIEIFNGDCRENALL